MRERTSVYKAQEWAAYCMLSYNEDRAKEMLSVLSASCGLKSAIWF